MAATDFVEVLSLDIGTLFIIATSVSLLLGVFLLFAWTQERIPALAWSGAAYLIGGFSGALWQFGRFLPVPVPLGVANIFLFVAVGMIWSAARLFHGRRVRYDVMLIGAIAWSLAHLSRAFSYSPMLHLLIGALIVAGYTVLTATELWRERRKALIRRWPAIFVPILHGAIFLLPVALATLSQDGIGVRGPASGWIALFAIEIVLYAVGAAFIVLILAKDRTVRMHKMAAATDPLTGVLNRRGLFEAAGAILAHSRAHKAPVSVLVFDLDHFKSINDRFGHSAGDTVLQVFAGVMRKTLRADDVIGRLGGEEFIAVLPGALADASMIAERVRAAIAAATIDLAGTQITVTVSVGVACGSPLQSLESLITRADAALYRAKAQGRNRVEASEEVVEDALANDLRQKVGALHPAQALLAIPGAEAPQLSPMRLAVRTRHLPAAD